MSDMHCHLQTVATPHSFVTVGALRRQKKQHPVLSLLDLADSDQNAAQADVLVMPGDLADQISQEGMSEAWQLTRDVAKKLSCQQIVPVIGNHDVDSHRTTPHPDTAHFARHLDDAFPFLDANQRNAFFAEGFCFVEITGGVEFVVLNSVADHLDRVAAKRGQFSSARVAALATALAARSPASIRIAVLHHHPVLHSSPFIGDQDVIETGQELVEVLRAAQCGLIIHGHKHHPRLRTVDTPAGLLPVFAAGSVGALLGALQGLTKNTFHMIDIEAPGVDRFPIRGHIRTWHWNLGSGWRPALEGAVDFPPRCGFGHGLALDALVEKVARSFAGSGRHLWHETELLSHASDLLYLTPGELSFVRAGLNTRHALELEFDSAGRFELGVLEGAP